MIRATRAPETSGRTVTGPPSVRYETNGAWPGIPADHPADWCDSCTRAWRGGRYQVKHLNTMCDTHRGWRP